MNEDITQPGKVKQPAPKPPADDGAIRVHRLWFRNGGVDLPTGEQQQSRITTDVRSDKPRYSIVWLPSRHVFLVRAWDRPNAKDTDKPSHTFTIPDSWAIAEHEL